MCRNLLVLIACGCLLSVPSVAQQVTVTTPLIGVNDSFYEHINLGWGFQRNWPGGSWFLNFGGPMSAIPPFGGYDPANDLRFGFGTRSFGGSSFFNLAASQGSNRTLTMTAPSVTMMNGVPGSIFSGSIRPFVTGLIPVVGDYPAAPYAVYPYPQFGAPYARTPVSPLAERLERLRNEPPAVRTAAASPAKDSLELRDEEEFTPAAGVSGPSSAERGDVSVAEIRKLQRLEEEAKAKELKRLIEEARSAERTGQLALARIAYKQAAARAEGEQRRELLEAAAKLTSPRNEPKH